MGFTEEDQCAEENYSIEVDDESSCEEYESDDSENDPSFDLEKEVRSSFSRLSVNRKSKSRISKKTEEGGSEEEASDVVEIDVPELGEEDQKSFEAVGKKIEAGQLDKLKVDQCKVYLRKYGLRLTGNKETLIMRIKEHLEILNGGGERKYPVSSFVLNCKGDACTGDIVMFEQNVYEMFSIASRSATGPPCGTRIVAGRIAKESYGAAKQQHTFTIEVLWSKGTKPLPPLHPLLIKGRNLYRLKTMRQKWQNEAERQKVISEKHNRGAAARSTREERIKDKEARKTLKAKRVPKMEKLKKMDPSQSETTSSRNLETHPHERQNVLQRDRESSLFPNIHSAAERIDQRQHFTSVPSRSSFQNQNCAQNMNSNPPRHQFQGPPIGTTFRNQYHGNGMKSFHSPHQYQNQQEYELNMNRGHFMVPPLRPLTNSFQNRCFERNKVCRYYVQGRCYYADQCKYLHEIRDNR